MNMEKDKMEILRDRERGYRDSGEPVRRLYESAEGLERRRKVWRAAKGVQDVGAFWSGYYQEVIDGVNDTEEPTTEEQVVRLNTLSELHAMVARDKERGHDDNGAPVRGFFETDESFRLREQYWILVKKGKSSVVNPERHWANYWKQEGREGFDKQDWKMEAERQRDCARGYINSGAPYMMTYETLEAYNRRLAWWETFKTTDGAGDPVTFWKDYFEDRHRPRDPKTEQQLVQLNILAELHGIVTRDSHQTGATDELVDSLLGLLDDVREAINWGHL